MTTIRLTNVSKKIRGVTVIDDISMTLTSGQVVGFRGINGSGKTMLMRLIAGLILPTKGQVTINDKQLGKDRKSTRLNSSHVANSYAVFCLKKKKELIEKLYHS